MDLLFSSFFLQPLNLKRQEQGLFPIRNLFARHLSRPAIGYHSAGSVGRCVVYCIIISAPGGGNQLGKAWSDAHSRSRPWLVPSRA